MPTTDFNSLPNYMIYGEMKEILFLFSLDFIKHLRKLCIIPSKPMSYKQFNFTSDPSINKPHIIAGYYKRFSDEYATCIASEGVKRIIFMELLHYEIHGLLCT
jgi:hypothetical protein